MKKFSKVLVVMLLVAGIFTLSGCGKDKEKKNNGVEITYEHGKGILTVTVPKDEDGNPKYEFTTEKPSGISTSKTFYLVTDNSMIGFATSGMSYNTSSKYKDKS